MIRDSDQLRRILYELVSYRTVSGDHTAMAGLLAYVESFVTERGMSVERIEDDGFVSLVAHTAPMSKRPSVMLAAHADVVPGDQDMFTVREADGRYHGRGVLDMKFAIAAYLQVIDDLKDHLDEYDFCVVITPDEEIGGEHGMAAVIDSGLRPGICILPDGGSNWQLQTASKGYWAFDISSKGNGAHGSRPWLGDNALLKLITALDEIAAMFPKVTDATTDTISLTRMSGGEAMNQIPGTARMTIDIRTIDELSHQRLHDGVVAICSNYGLDCRVVSKSPPTVTDPAHPLISPFVNLIRDVTGVDATGWLAPAASDARYLVPHDIPFIAVYPTGAGHHTDDEWIDSKAVGDFAVIIRRYLEQAGRRTPA